MIYLNGRDNALRLKDATDLTARKNNMHQWYMTILRYDSQTRMMLASIRSDAVQQDMVLALKLDEHFTVQRQDALIHTDGMIVGSGPLSDAGIDDLRQGVRGLGIIAIDADGSSVIKYLLIGDPFPRP